MNTLSRPIPALNGPGYYRLAEKLRRRGFAEDTARLRLPAAGQDEAFTLDVMPVGEAIPGLGSAWYRKSLENHAEHAHRATVAEY